MPLGRFQEKLEKENSAESYMKLLADSFNPSTLEALMCRHQICIDWDGTLYDCDFNLALGLNVSKKVPPHIDNLDIDLLLKRKIITGDHCYGCTAGAGSSCSGALTS
jgi:radical SAM/Cys-rich protein